MVLATGDIVPADLRLLQADEIKVHPRAREHKATILCYSRSVDPTAV